MRRRSHFGAFVLVDILAFLVSPNQCLGDSPTDYGGTVEASFHLDASGGVSLGGAELSLTFASLTLPADSIGPVGPTIWYSDPFNWSLTNSVPVGYNIIERLFDVGGNLVDYDTHTQEVSYFYQDFIDKGPTERTVDLPVSPLGFHFGPVKFGVIPSVLLKYNVTIEGGRHVFLDQDATIESLTIGTDSSLTYPDDFYSLLVRNRIDNAGTFLKTGSTIVTLDIPFINAGLLEILDGTLRITGGGGTLSNSGTVVQFGYSDLEMTGYAGWWGSNAASLENLAGGLYDLQGDGDILLGPCPNPEGSIGPQYNIISNYGTFLKSAGSGESVIEGEFRNSGLLDVQSGMVTLRGGGRIENGSVHLAEGTFLRLPSVLGGTGIFTLSGEDNEITGPGSVEIPAGGIMWGTTGTTRLYGGTQLLVDGGTVYLDNGASLLLGGDTRTQLSAGSLGGRGTVAVDGLFDWTGGSITGWGQVVHTGPGLTIDGSAEKRIAEYGHLVNSGMARQVGDSVVTMTGFIGWWGSNAASLENLAGGLYDLQGDGDIVLGPSPHPEGSVRPDENRLCNYGTFRKSAGAGESVIEAEFRNRGLLDVQSGTLTFSGGFTQTAGVTSVNGGTITSTSPLNILGGSVEGTGEIVADILNQGGFFSPGFSPGTLTIDGDYTQGPDATLLLEITGLQPGQFDVVNVTGTATLDGFLEIMFLDGFRPSLGDTFAFFNYGSHIGEFNSVFVNGFPDYQFASLYGARGLTLMTQTTPAIPCPGSIMLGSIGVGFVTLLRRRRAM